MKIVFFDVETSGLDEGHHEIIQIAACATEDMVVVDEFERKLMFDLSKASKEALAINSYDPDVWDREQISQGCALSEFTQWLKKYKDVTRYAKRSGRAFKTVRMAAHNAPFDMKFLQAWYRKHDKFCPADFLALDTLQLVMWHDWDGKIPIKNYKLGTLCEFLGIPLEGAHDALVDIRANVEVAKRLMNSTPKVAG